MLNSLELQECLVQAGFTPDIKVRIAKFTHGETTVYVKTPSGKGNEDSPVIKEPLVLRPEWLPLLDTVGGIEGVYPNREAFFHNSNLREFPQGMSSRGKINFRGLAVNVENKQALAKLLTLVCDIDLSDLPYFDGSHEPDSTTLSETEKARLALARIGQGKYRKALLSYWNGCAVTGTQQPELLKASHMKPWRFSDNSERLDPYNGLLLSANLDAAFDSGLITFSSQGDILISKGFSEASDFGIQPSMKLRKLDAQHQEYLTWHRDNEFKG